MMDWLFNFYFLFYCSFCKPFVSLCMLMTLKKLCFNFSLMYSLYINQHSKFYRLQGIFYTFQLLLASIIVRWRWEKKMLHSKSKLLGICWFVSNFNFILNSNQSFSKDSWLFFSTPYTTFPSFSPSHHCKNSLFFLSIFLLFCEIIVLEIIWFGFYDTFVPIIQIIIFLR
jgi:hypothetical protein